MTKEAAGMVKDTGKQLKKTAKDLSKSIKKAQKLLNKVPKVIPKYTSTKKFDKYMVKQDKLIDKTMSRNLKDAEKDFKGLSKTIGKTKDGILRELSALEKNDQRDTATWRDTAKELGKSMKDLAKEIRETAST